MSSVLQQAVAMTKQTIEIVYVKETESEAIPAGSVEFSRLINTEGDQIRRFAGKL